MADQQQTKEKRLAGAAAAAYVETGMTVGLGTGSTVRFAIEHIAARIKEEGLNVRGVPTSRATRELAQTIGIPLVSLNDAERVDVTIDGADEVDHGLNGIKGGGGALLFEKIVASASDRNIWVADSGKRVDALGRFPLPVEVVPFASAVVLQVFKEEGMNPVVRADGQKNFMTDSGNFIIDLHLGRIHNPEKLEQRLNLIPGVVENGLFLNRADLAIVGSGDDVVEYRRHT